MTSAIKVRVVCPECGPVVLPAKEIRCELQTAGDKGMCELSCPVCSTTVLVPAGPVAVQAMREGGAGHMRGSIPFELLEPHVGPPLSWNDLLDFKLALDSRPDPLSSINEY
jgi:hypothetical protein